MERTASRHPSRGGTSWAIFFAPLGVTALVIVGAMIFVWVSDLEPAERPEVERVDLREMQPAAEAQRYASVPRRGDVDEDAGDRRSERRARLNAEGDGAVSSAAMSGNVTSSGSSDVSDDDDDEYGDDDAIPSGRVYTPEERLEGKRNLREIAKRLPFIARTLDRIEQKERQEASMNGVESPEPAPDQKPDSAANEAGELVLPSYAGEHDKKSGDKHQQGPGGAGSH